MLLLRQQIRGNLGSMRLPQGETSHQGRLRWSVGSRRQARARRKTGQAGPSSGGSRTSRGEISVRRRSQALRPSRRMQLLWCPPGTLPRSHAPQPEAKIYGWGL